MISRYLIFTFFILFALSVQGQKSKKGKASKEQPLQLYDGEARPSNEIVTIKTIPSGKQNAYFIGLDDASIPGNSLVNGAHEIMILPGRHKIQMRFVSKGEIAVPVEPFDEYEYEAGKTYEVKYEYTPGKGSYIDAAFDTKIKLWIVDTADQNIVSEIMANGMGQRAKE